MSRLLVGTDGVETSERVAEYLRDVLASDDQVYVLNSLVGGDETDREDVEAGEDALRRLVEEVDDLAHVESHQLVQGNQPVEDLLDAADDWGADEFVIGIRKRSPVGKVVFGSTAQNLLLEADRPVRCVPLVSEGR